MKMNIKSCASGVLMENFQKWVMSQKQLVVSPILSLTSVNAQVLIRQSIQFQGEDQTQDEVSFNLEQF